MGFLKVPVLEAEPAYVDCQHIKIIRMHERGNVQLVFDDQHWINTSSKNIDEMVLAVEAIRHRNGIWDMDMLQITGDNDVSH